MVGGGVAGGSGVVGDFFPHPKKNIAKTKNNKNAFFISSPPYSFSLLKFLSYKKKNQPPFPEMSLYVT